MKRLIVAGSLILILVPSWVLAWPESDAGAGTKTETLIVSATKVGDTPLFTLGPSTRSAWTIPRGGALGEAQQNTAVSAVGYYTKNHWALIGEFGAANEGIGLLGGLRFGYLFDWVMPHVGISTRGVGSEPGVGPMGGIAFMVPWSETSGLMLDVTVTDFGNDPDHGGTVVSLGSTVLLPLK